MDPTIQQLYQAYANIVELCRRKGIKNVVLAPGSRSAPLAIAFFRNEAIQKYIVPDERAAGFTALGMVQATHEPVALVSTSGTASLNYGPAIAEAYFQQLPLVAFTADRPPEWLGQQENQTIYQEGIYGPNLKKEFHLPVDWDRDEVAWNGYHQINEALNLAVISNQGPVHINAPFREPFYPIGPIPKAYEKLHQFDVQEPSITPDEKEQSQLSEALNKHENIMILGGMQHPDPYLKAVIQDFTDRFNAVFIPDTVSNLHQVEGAILGSHGIFDYGLSSDEEFLKPDLLISFGGPVVSKPLKQYLRKFPPQEHWHIDPAGYVPNTFQALSKSVKTMPYAFFSRHSKDKSTHKNKFLKLWENLDQAVLNETFQEDPYHEFTELASTKYLLKMLPENSILHLANSLPVRHLTQLGLSNAFIHYSIELYANRGTSGIDGCLSTSVGHARKTDRVVSIILGDMAFMYDRNALWQENLPANLNIIVLNNHGGGIFRTMEGPRHQLEYEEYFVTKQHLHFKLTASQHHCRYQHVNSWDSLKGALQEMRKPRKTPFILELDFKNSEIDKSLKRLKQNILKACDSVVKG